MENVKIFLSMDNERIEDESKESGFRGDVNVEIDGMNYHLFVNDVRSFMQEAEREIGERGFYDLSPNTVIVSEVTKENIIFTINQLYHSGFFAKLKTETNPYYPKNYRIQ